MATARQVFAAAVAMAEADTGSGGLVELHGDANPAVRWGDAGMNRRPVTALLVDVTARGRGTSGVRQGEIRISAFVPDGSGDLDSRILARWEEVLTTSGFITRGIDARIEWGAEMDLTALEAEGTGVRLDLHGKITFTR